MDCSQPFSPCKGLSAVSFVNGCCLVNTIRRPVVVGEISKPGRSRIGFYQDLKELQKQHKANTPQEPCGRRVRDLRYSYASSPNASSTDKHSAYPELLQILPERGAPAMNPRSLGFSRKLNPSARHCVGIPKIWVLPTQDSQTASLNTQRMTSS